MVQGSGLSCQDSWFMVQAIRFRVQGSGFRGMRRRSKNPWAVALRNLASFSESFLIASGVCTSTGV
ncbi:hypothetical protein T484DRAFT_3503743 [Baffinella frigidus]|nr:hypothetical protein T484DRAFT_3503743 [Cryptophyta sp. CCMP2293]